MDLAKYHCKVYFYRSQFVDFGGTEILPHLFLPIKILFAVYEIIHTVQEYGNIAD